MKTLVKASSTIAILFSAAFMAMGDKTGLVISLIVLILFPLILLRRPRTEITLPVPAPKRK